MSIMIKIQKLTAVPGEGSRELSERQASYKKKVQEYSDFLAGEFDFHAPHIIRSIAYSLTRLRRMISLHHVYEDARIVGNLEKALIGFGRLTSHDYVGACLKPVHAVHGHPKMVRAGKSADGGSILTVLYNGKPATKEMSRAYKKALDKAERAKRKEMRAAFMHLQTTLEELGL